jgi:hypothetical protein
MPNFRPGQQQLLAQRLRVEAALAAAAVHKLAGHDNDLLALPVPVG